ncbi:hypothetical protein [Micromonospora sp. KC606]|uniref:hypothetical protein n=1 Tax=Micromonospora sp. KC606 TaxID=2530379 RepID=UPI001A9DB3BF|nr:hypothetical protein [Micromonospora sp. KC606]
MPTLDLDGAIITADALHTQRDHARWLIENKKAGYVFVVKRNQRRLYRQVKTLPWAKIPVLDVTHDRGHDRRDIRRLQTITCLGPRSLDLPPRQPGPTDPAPPLQPGQRPLVHRHRLRDQQPDRRPSRTR